MFFVALPNDGGDFRVRSWCRHSPPFREILHSLSPPNSITHGNCRCILYPTAFPVVEVESSQPDPQQHRPETGRSSTNGRSRRPPQSHQHTHTDRVEESLGWHGFWGIIVSWTNRKIGSNAIANRKPLAGQPCLTHLAIQKCPLDST